MFPIGLWGRVLRPPPGEPELIAVRIEPQNEGSFLILTREPTGEFDSWVEGSGEVMDYLSSMEVDWCETEV
jgi:hypothetical protein